MVRQCMAGLGKARLAGWEVTLPSFSPALITDLSGRDMAGLGGARQGIAWRGSARQGKVF